MRNVQTILAEPNDPLLAGASMEANGFQLAKERPFLPYQYFLVFTAEQ